MSQIIFHWAAKAQLSSHSNVSSYLISPRGSAVIWTFHLRIMCWVYYHCVTVSQLPPTNTHEPTTRPTQSRKNGSWRNASRWNDILRLQNWVQERFKEKLRLKVSRTFWRNDKLSSNKKANDVTLKWLTLQLKETVTWVGNVSFCLKTSRLEAFCLQRVCAQWSMCMWLCLDVCRFDLL